MRAVVQRVNESTVKVKGQIEGSIGRGLLILLAVGRDDMEKDTDYLAGKISNLRIFPDDSGQMNLSLLDISGEALVVSQFTLWGDCRKGRRPSFAQAAPPDQAKDLYDLFIDKLREKGVSVATGRFQEMMDVYLINEGPVTILLDSAKNF